ncbi:MAG: TAT-variant-translocated molybdopterin oxidoreductase [Phycisphaerales bacterium]|nr:TAT-variant-translocated molybdopterin oxidoreductase [Phycisphaerales bacterium]
MPPLIQERPGPLYWRSLDELADTPEFRKFVESEFPSLAHELVSGASRRQFLKLMGASLALAGLTGCRWPRETIVPATRQGQDRIPGQPVQYATAIELDGVATGALVTSYDGRPIKVEGNDLHPYSRGKSTAWMQATVLDLYDPDRSILPIRRTERTTINSSFAEFDAFANEHFAALRGRGGEGLCVLVTSSSSPTFREVKGAFRKAYPKAGWFEYDAIPTDNVREGARVALGQVVRTHIELAKADIVVSLDSDFLMTHPAALKYARDFADRRRRADSDGTMCRLYVFESDYTVTGSNADHRVPIRSADVGALASALSAALDNPASARPPASVPAAVFAALVEDLRSHRGTSVILAGAHQPPAVHALAHHLNARLGNVGTTVTYTGELDMDRPPHLTAIRELAQRMNDGAVETLLILGGNPVITAPSDIGFADGLAKVSNSIHLAERDNETSRACSWHVPQAHTLETWGDAQAYDGTTSLIQPLIAPLFGGRTTAEFLARLTGDEVTAPYELVRRTFGGLVGNVPDFEKLWEDTLRTGVLRDSIWATIFPQTRTPPAIEPAPNDGFEVVFAPDYKLYDGRFRNNAWLQELPDPITKLTWDNAALISPADARRLGVARNGDMIRIEVGGRSVNAPACILPGHADGSVTLKLGYGGGKAAGKVAQGVGFDAFALRSSTAMHIATGAKVSRASGSHKLVSTQDHHAMASDIGDRETQRRVNDVLIRSAPLPLYQHHPDFAQHTVHLPQAANLWKEKEYPPPSHKWGMTIDLTACIGCGACVTACQAENNIPVVGKDEVALGREMHWIRVDRYFKGDPKSADVEIVHQPMTCVHCENAPCEQVCPVGATVHDEEGLNTMVYNRCIGTRYCSNNCPFKVRRFNWYYNHHGPYHPRTQNAEPGGPKVGLLGPTKPNEPVLVPGKVAQTPVADLEKLQFNPNVTVRSRGVMEKCTFCTHRINEVKIKARNERWPTIPDGLITPACAQACPTDAIVFGDLNDPNSRVSKLQQHARAYGILEELNIKPRTKYLAKITNPAGAKTDAAPGGHGHG